MAASLPRRMQIYLCEDGRSVPCLRLAAGMHCIFSTFLGVLG